MSIHPLKTASQLNIQVNVDFCPTYYLYVCSSSMLRKTKIYMLTFTMAEQAFNTLVLSRIFRKFKIFHVHIFIV